MEFKTKLLIVFIMPLIGFFLFGCLPETNQDKSEFVKVVISERTFKVPRGYFDGRTPSGRDAESVVLEYSLPNFEVLPPQPQERAARQELIMRGLQRSMLLEAERNRPSVSVSISNHMRGRNYEKKDGEYWGLEKYQQPKSTGKYPTLHDDFFIEKDNNGEILGNMFCSPPSKDKVPGCIHRFIDKEIIYQIGWPIRELSNWKSQKQNAINFIDKLEVKNSE